MVRPHAHRNDSHPVPERRYWSGGASDGMMGGNPAAVGSDAAVGVSLAAGNGRTLPQRMQVISSLS